MATIKIQLGRDPAFEQFLGAPVGQDDDGANVTVLSMFARLGVDPWDEASDLAKMPEVPARQRLEALLARFKDVPTTVAERGSIALGLLVFLPKQVKSSRPSPKSPKDPATPAARWSLPSLGVPLYLVLLALVCLGWIATLSQGN